MSGFCKIISICDKSACFLPNISASQNIFWQLGCQAAPLFARLHSQNNIEVHFCTLLLVNRMRCIEMLLGLLLLSLVMVEVKTQEDVDLDDSDGDGVPDDEDEDDDNDGIPDEGNISQHVSVHNYKLCYSEDDDDDGDGVPDIYENDDEL